MYVTLTMLAVFHHSVTGVAEILSRESDNILMIRQRKSEQEPAVTALHLHGVGGAGGNSLLRLFTCLVFRVTGKRI